MMHAMLKLLANGHVLHGWVLMGGKDASLLQAQFAAFLPWDRLGGSPHWYQRRVTKAAESGKQDGMIRKPILLHLNAASSGLTNTWSRVVLLQVGWISWQKLSQAHFWMFTQPASAHCSIEGRAPSFWFKSPAMKHYETQPFLSMNSCISEFLTKLVCLLSSLNGFRLNCKSIDYSPHHWSLLELEACCVEAIEIVGFGIPIIHKWLARSITEESDPSVLATNCRKGGWSGGHCVPICMQYCVWAVSSLANLNCPSLVRWDSLTAQIVWWAEAGSCEISWDLLGMLPQVYNTL